MSLKRPSGSDSESDTPEAISLSSSKKTSEARAKKIKAYESDQRAKKKNENREKDRLLKEEKTKRNERKQPTAAEERMERAMKQAAEEDSGENSQDDDVQVEDESVDDDIGEEMEEGDFGEEEEWSGIVTDPDIAAKKLPDHIFSAAAASQATTKTATNLSTRKSDKKTKTEKTKKKQKTNQAKEHIVGNRTIQVLSLDSPITNGNQSLRVKRFIDKQLQLHRQEVTVATTPSLTKRSGPVGRQKIISKDDSKMTSGKSKLSKGWTRMPVNLGAMRRTGAGPVMNFVRDSIATLSRP